MRSNADDRHAKGGVADNGLQTGSTAGGPQAEVTGIGQTIGAPNALFMQPRGQCMFDEANGWWG